MRLVSPLDAVGTANHPKGSAIDCLDRGNLNFTVEKVPMRHPLRPTETVDGFFNVIRTDTGQVLSTVGDRYTPIQNQAFFGTIADTIVSQTQATISRCYSSDGTRVYMVLDWPQDRSTKVVGDVVRCRAILQNSHDSTVAALFRLQPMRLICRNGMVVPDRSFSFSFKIRHTESADARIHQAVDISQRAGRAFDTFGRAMNIMAQTPVDSKLARTIIDDIMLRLDPKKQQPTTSSRNKSRLILNLFNGRQSGGDHVALRGTAWGLYNAFAEYADHHATVRVTKRSSGEAEQRFKAVIDGSGRQLKLDAYEAIVAEPALGLKERLDKILRN